MWGPRKSYLNADEPQLDDVLDDPVIQAVMSRDGVVRDDIVDLALAVRARFDTAAKNSVCCGFK
ncbi:MAG TPA: hypothetical protein VGB82_19540 [Alphaproteobacteria bacterium]